MLVYNSETYPKKTFPGQPALFLDRDGVINTEVNYLYRIKDFEFIDGIFDLCRAAAENGYPVIVITNQSGIARGYYTQEDLGRLTKWMLREFAGRGIGIAAVYACPHLPEADIEQYRRDCECRKPNPGMILQAQRDFDIGLPDSAFIGDKMRDLEAADSAGVGSLLLFGDNISVPEQFKNKIDVVSSLKQARKKLFG